MFSAVAIASHGLSDPLALWAETCERATVAADIWAAAAGAGSALASRRATRLEHLITRARRHSVLYAQKCADLPEQAPLHALPVMTKSQLMAGFDHWATDPEVTSRSINAFTRRVDRIGADYLGRYAVWTSSGTTGRAGQFVQPRSALTVYDALLAARSAVVAAPMSSAFAPPLPGALIAALDGHYAGVVTWRRLQRKYPWLAPQLHALSVKQPLDVLVAQLNTIRPRFLSSYPTVLLALAEERARGALQFTPARIWSGGECLSPQARRRIESVFGCTMVNDYGASECMSIAFECAHGRQHLNADWVVLEPVDRHFAPVVAGEPSHTTLLTNLANPLQPLIRYDLGDSITMHDTPCRCGSGLPSFAVAGRAADVLMLRRRDGSNATLVPLALQSAVEEGTQHGGKVMTLFQIVQSGPETLQLRTCSGRRRTRARGADDARGALHDLLVRHGLAHVDVQLDATPIKREPGSGKLRQVVARPV